MKKLLVASTALVAVAAVSPAQAADPIKLSVGGFMNQMVGYIDQTETNSANAAVGNFVDITNISDTELYFRGSTKLDNGLTVAVNIDVEGDRGSTGQDDVFMSVASDTLGKVELGATKDVVYDMAITAPVGGIGLTDGDWDAFSDINEPDDDSKGFSGNDGQKINYWTPNFGGFQAGLTYGVEAAGNQSGAINAQTATADYVVGAAVGYKGEFSGVSVGADLGYLKSFQGGDEKGTADAVENDPSMFHYGLSVGAAGFTVAGGYVSSSDTAGTIGRDVDAFEVGVSYATGPYTLSAGWLQVEDNNGDATANSDEEFNLFVAAVDYDLGAGVSASLSVFDGETDDQTDTADRESFGVVTGIKASF